MSIINKISEAVSRTLEPLVRRVIGRSYPSRDIAEIQRVHGKRGAHVLATWTTPEHFAHNNYERGHLPQLCIVASGWKARVIAALLWPLTPWTPNSVICDFASNQTSATP